SSFIYIFYVYRYSDHRSLPSFPTRRSSDLHQQGSRFSQRFFLVSQFPAQLFYFLFVAAGQLAYGLVQICTALKALQGRRLPLLEDRKSTRLNSSHVKISYAVFCLKKKRYDT